MTDERVVVITGSASGIGQATAAAWLARGATVHGWDLAEHQPDPAPSGAPGRWVPHRVAVRDEDAIVEALAAGIARDGRVVVLGTSAAVGFPEPFAEISAESWNRVLRINVTGTMLCIREALPGMIERGSGCVVVISSIAGRTKSVANGAHYTVSKYGLIGLTRHLAAELAGTGVRINCVAPGPTNSPILTANSTAEELQSIIDRTPLRRIAEPEDIASVVLFAADERARHIHGAVLDVNGGLY